MKKSVFILALLSVITLMSACKKEPSITQGVYGTVIERYGDWMPGANADHGERPVACDVYVYEYTMLSDFGGGISVNYPIDAMPKPFVAKTTSNAKGFYEINLAPGTYKPSIEKQRSHAILAWLRCLLCRLHPHCLTNQENTLKLSPSVLNIYSGCHCTAQTKRLPAIFTASMRPSGDSAIGIKSLPRSLMAW